MYTFKIIITIKAIITSTKVFMGASIILHWKTNVSWLSISEICILMMLPNITNMLHWPRIRTIADRLAALEN
jgi:predicted CDP-diglyceride synthetase/phosphatidate cytidylyltransferase